MADQPLPTIRCRQCCHAVAQWDQKCPLCGSPIEENVQAQSEATRWWLAGAGLAALLSLLGVILVVALVSRPKPGSVTARQESQQTRGEKPSPAIAPVPPRVAPKSPEQAKPERSEPARRIAPADAGEPQPRQDQQAAAPPANRGTQSPGADQRQAAPAPAGPAPSGTAAPYGARSTPQIAAAPESRGQQAQD